jgi:hypothetical protein
MSRRVRERTSTELGDEIQCSKCREFWPEDPEFFFFSKGEAHSWCKACYRADPNMIGKNERWQAKQRGDRPKRERLPDVPVFQFAPLMRAMHPELEEVQRAMEPA